MKRAGVDIPDEKGKLFRSYYQSLLVGGGISTDTMAPFIGHRTEDPLFRDAYLRWNGILNNLDPRYREQVPEFVPLGELERIVATGDAS